MVRPNEWHTRALILHARADHVTGVTNAKGERAIHPRQRANLEGHVLTDVVNDPNIARCVLRIDALANDPARIIDTECCEKETSVRCRLRDDRRAAAAVDHAALVASGVD